MENKLDSINMNSEITESKIVLEQIFKKKNKTYLDKILLSLDMNNNIPMTIEELMIKNNHSISKQCYYYSALKSGIQRKLIRKIINPEVKTKFKGHKYILL